MSGHSLCSYASSGRISLTKLNFLASYALSTSLVKSISFALRCPTRAGNEIEEEPSGIWNEVEKGAKNFEPGVQYKKVKRDESVYAMPTHQPRTKPTIGLLLFFTAIVTVRSAYKFVNVVPL